MWKHMLIAAFLAWFYYWSLGFLAWFGYFQRMYNHGPKFCRKLDIPDHGSEDIQCLSNGLAFISSGFKDKNQVTYAKREAKIYLFDFKTPDVPPQELKIQAEKGFKLESPHGLSLWTDPVTDDVYLYLISHQFDPPAETVDKFLFDDRKVMLMHMRQTQNDHNFHRLNDLVVVSDDMFYFTNYHYYSGCIEASLGLQWGSLGFYEGSSSKLIETGLNIPNGIALSPDRKLLYVATAGDESIRVYHRFSNNSIAFSHNIHLRLKVDNLDVDQITGDIWAAGHPIAYKILQYLEDPTLTSPSQVLRIKVSKDGKARNIEEIYVNDGSQLSASSVATVYGNEILIGSVASQTLYCKRK